MNSRPAIPRATQLDLLYEVRYRCACDCEPVSLQKAHMIPWRETKDHSFENLVVLCANCHTRADSEKWPESTLRRFKERPCALERDRMPPMSSEQKVLVDMIIAAQPDSMTDKQRLRFVAMVAAYAGVNFSQVSVISMAATNSSLLRLEMPHSAAEKIITAFQAQDPRFVSFLDDFALTGEALVSFGPNGGIKMVETARPTAADKPPVTNVKEEGLESLIFNSMTNFGWIAGKNTDYDREYAVDLPQLAAFHEATQEVTGTALQLGTDGTVRRKFLARLQGEITRRGVIDVLRKGVAHEKFHIDLFYGTPSAENQKAVARYASNRFSITRQLHLQPRRD